jgi:O-antigen/teichoic acid export membrane protein
MKYKRLLVDATVYSFAGYLIQPLAIVSSLMVRGAIGPYLAGVMATLNLILYYASFSHLGVLNAAERDLPVCLGSRDNDRFNRMRDTTFVTSLFLALIFAVGLVVWSLWSKSHLEAQMFAGILVYAFYVFVWMWSGYYLILLRTSQEFVFLGKIQILIGVLSSVGNVVMVLLFGFSGLLAMTLVVIIAQTALLSRRVEYASSLRMDWQELKGLLLVGVPMLLFGLAVTGIRTVDNILVLRFLGTEALGFYSIALLANTAIFAVSNSLSGVLYPRMLKAYGGNPTIQTLSLYIIRPSILIAVILPFLIGGLFYLMPPAVVGFLPRFSPGISALRIVSVSSFFLALYLMSVNFLVALNKQLRATVFLVVGIAMSTLSGIIFTRYGWGLNGIALAAGIGYAFCFASVNVDVLRHWVRWEEVAIFFGDLCAPIAYATVVLLVLDKLPMRLTGGVISGFVIAVVKLSLFCLAYLPMVFLMDRKSGLISDFVKPLIRRLVKGPSN